jgi:Flp pilus assembly pilin Flp
MLPITVRLISIRLHLAVLAMTELIVGRLVRLREERGQTSAEYALVLLGAATVALLIALWAKNTDKIGGLLDAMFDKVTGMAP